MQQRDDSIREHEIQMDLLRNQLTESRGEMDRILDQNHIEEKLIKDIRSFIYTNERQQMMSPLHESDIISDLKYISEWVYQQI